MSRAFAVSLARGEQAHSWGDAWWGAVPPWQRLTWTSLSIHAWLTITSCSENPRPRSVHEDWFCVDETPDTCLICPSLWSKCPLLQLCALITF